VFFVLQKVHRPFKKCSVAAAEGQISRIRIYMTVPGKQENCEHLLAVTLCYWANKVHALCFTFRACFTHLPKLSLDTSAKIIFTPFFTHVLSDFYSSVSKSFAGIHFFLC
jgi:hypothetical protein